MDELMLLDAIHTADFSEGDVALIFANKKNLIQSYQKVFSVAKSMGYEFVKCLNGEVMTINNNTYHFIVKDSVEYKNFNFDDSIVFPSLES